MPDFNSTSDVVLAQWRQGSVAASQDQALWRFLFTIGTGLLVVLGVVAVILAAYGLSAGWRRPPPPPTSIISGQPETRSRYTAKERR
jgi:hypothetical protein